MKNQKFIVVFMSGGNIFIWGSVIDIPGFCLYDHVKEFISEVGDISDEGSALSSGLIINRKIVDTDPDY
jgi:hypothetical protein